MNFIQEQYIDQPKNSIRRKSFLYTARTGKAIQIDNDEVILINHVDEDKCVADIISDNGGVVEKGAELYVGLPRHLPYSDATITFKSMEGKHAVVEFSTGLSSVVHVYQEQILGKDGRGSKELQKVLESLSDKELTSTVVASYNSPAIAELVRRYNLLLSEK